MNILGISAFYHDSAAALVQDGVIAAAAQEERFTRVRHDAAFPSRAVELPARQGELGWGTSTPSSSTRNRSSRRNGCWRPTWAWH